MRTDGDSLVDTDVEVSRAIMSSKCASMHVHVTVEEREDVRMSDVVAFGWLDECPKSHKPPTPLLPLKVASLV